MEQFVDAEALALLAALSGSGANLIETPPHVDSHFEGFRRPEQPPRLPALWPIYPPGSPS
jgi:hypothetical protein